MSRMLQQCLTWVNDEHAHYRVPATETLLVDSISPALAGTATEAQPSIADIKKEILSAAGSPAVMQTEPQAILGTVTPLGLVSQQEIKLENEEEEFEEELLATGGDDEDDGLTSERHLMNTTLSNLQHFGSSLFQGDVEDEQDAFDV